jgi:hypothetical protein
MERKMTEPTLLDLETIRATEPERGDILYVVYSNCDLSDPHWREDFEFRYGITRWDRLVWWFEDRLIDFRNWIGL